MASKPASDAGPVWGDSEVHASPGRIECDLRSKGVGLPYGPETKGKKVLTSKCDVCNLTCIRGKLDMRKRDGFTSQAYVHKFVIKLLGREPVVHYGMTCHGPWLSPAESKVFRDTR